MISQELNQQSKPWFVIVSVVAFAAVLFFSVYYEIQQSRLEGAIGEMEAKKQELTARTTEGDASSDRARALTAKEYLQELEKKQVVWSKIVEKVESVIPRRTEGNAPFVVFRSYSGSSEGRLAVNAVTQTGAVDPFTDIALTVRAFTSDPTFKNVFVPSIAKSVTPDGQSILSFSMNFEYNPQNLLSRPRTETAPASATSDTTPPATPTTPTTPTATTPAAPVTPAPATPVAPVTPAR